MSLFQPPPGFPPHLAYFWPLIWCQVLLLRAAVRAAYGKGVQYHWSVSPNGRVFLTSIDWMPSQKSGRDWLTPSSHKTDRLTAACDGRAATPAYAHFQDSRVCGCGGAPVFPAPAACSRAGAENLPLPET
ncbi:hypothetical protein HAD_05970 [Hyphomonas adhaerens MHS-3]|uniref:Uncharacterized protein n=1 Tax=Hyphomonas adhaerens MHS-3 TaxID=1280949 RepID=A0A069E4P4_9PROT|nr:hypothetical protein [Hyphomonas adhaerens]KCZ85205.1 hypothetical protein HAD_05970 [Hyphomonas adhaerens MHS-3]